MKINILNKINDMENMKQIVTNILANYETTPNI